MTATVKRIGNWIGMADGRRFYPLDPRADEVRIEDIAHCLAHTCRFGGRTSEFFSVAQHSCFVMQLVQRTHPELALAALLHDAAEAYIGDIVKPFKEHLWVADAAPFGVVADIGTVEAAIQRAIHEAFGIEPVPGDHRDIIKHADAVALATEARDLMGDPKWPGLVRPWCGVIVPWDAKQAKRHFLDAFNRLAAKEARHA